ncbi:TvLac7 [Cubamyces sp. BRFM 1775]|nr:TvLac7 [Cubamyces sp. BRFM 1775]
MCYNTFWRFTLLLGLLGKQAFAIGPVSVLEIVNKVIAPDGIARDTVLAQGVFPGPPIVAWKGDRFLINVVNRLVNETMLTSTSIHWHGLYQHSSAWADGTAFVTQCPIVSGKAFEYAFEVPDQTGTFWYHSHLATQYCDGLRGALVIYDPDDPHGDLYDVDDESTIITLADWYHVAAALQTGIPESDTTLINGLGRWFGNPTSELAVITVQQGKRYRFRLLNIACDPNYMFSIDGHTMSVIEADGQNTEPLNVDTIQIFAAQRYSFVLEANQPVDNYWIRANPDRNRATGFANGINSAILRYEGAPNEEPATTEAISSRLLNEAALQPLTGLPVPGLPAVGDVDYALNLNLTNNGTYFLVNGVPFIPPPIPVLLQVLNGTIDARDFMPHGSVYTLPRNSSIELTMPAGVVGGPHPFHLHGHAFYVVRSAGSEEYNYVNPVQRDTVSIGSAGDNVTIRFRTDNPGPWLLHCHIDWHLQTGLAVVFVEDAQDIKADVPVPGEWKQLCPTYDHQMHINP